LLARVGVRRAKDRIVLGKLGLLEQRLAAVKEVIDGGNGSPQMLTFG
jgi:hypothetical protein